MIDKSFHLSYGKTCRPDTGVEGEASIRRVGRGMRLLFSALFLSFILSSCEEIGPVIDLTGTFDADTTYVTTDIEAPQLKNVLLEEFTGVRCVNCPKAHELLDNLEAQHGARFISVSAHSRFQSEPYDGDPHLRVLQADTLEILLGGPEAKPSGAIDRKKFAGNNPLAATAEWSSYVSQQMGVSTPVNIHLDLNFSQNERLLTAIVTLHYTADDTLESRLSVELLEDGIITAQSGESGVDSNYVQNRVLRRILPSTPGMPLTISRERGRVIVRSFETVLDDSWNENNLRVVALVHRSQNVKDVVQVVQAEVMP